MWCRDLYIRVFLLTKVELYVQVCSAAVWFCSCVEACSPSFIRLCRGGLEWPWVAGPLPIFQEHLFTKVKLYVEACSAGMWFLSCVEVLLLNLAASWGLKWPWVAGPLAMFQEQEHRQGTGNTC